MPSLLGAGALTVMLGLRGGGIIYPAARRIGYAVCHQLPSHSYAAWGMTLPLCARCTGQYLGALVMLASTLWLGGRTIQRFPTRSGLVLLGILVLAWVVDGFNSYLEFLGLPHLYAPRNLLRLITGMGEGVALMAMFWPIFSQATWATQGRRRVCARHLLLTLGIAWALALFIHFGDARIRYTLGLVSTFGVPIIMSMLFSVFLRLLSGRVGKSTSGWELALFLAGGLVITLAAIVGVGTLRDLLPPIVTK